jgi:hypothetical membrane protein
MEAVVRFLRGDFQQHEIRRYLAFEAVTFWSLILIAWLLYPAAHKYSIMTHTFSFLGSFNEEHDPQWWWVFTVAMVFWGVATVPVVFYLYRRFALIAPWGAPVGAGLFLLACLGATLVGLFPDARATVFGNVRWTEIHEKATLLIVIGYGLGIPFHGLLLLKDWIARALHREPGPFDHGKLAVPFLCWGAIVGVAVYFQVKWEFVYAQMKAAAQASGGHIGSHWSEALNTRYSFPLWENIVIYTIFAFLIWFTFVMSGQTVPSKKEPR